MNTKQLNEIEKKLSGGHPNSLGNTIEIVELVLADETQNQMNKLCETYDSKDEIVRLRVSSALKRVAGLHQDSFSQKNPPRPEWILQRFDWLVDEIGWKLDQPSAKWSISQILYQLDSLLDEEQRVRGIKLMKYYLTTESDWIVLSNSAEKLTNLSLVKQDHDLKAWLIPQLEKLSQDKRKSVSSKSLKCLKKLNEEETS